MSAFNLSVYGGQLTLSTQLLNPKFCVSRPHRRSTAVSLEPNPLVSDMTTENHWKQGRRYKKVGVLGGYRKSSVSLLRFFVVRQSPQQFPNNYFNVAGDPVSDTQGKREMCSLADRIRNRAS